MGRHRRQATKNNGVKNVETTDERYLTEKVEKRLFNKKICMSCNSRNPENAESCRKCGSKQLRQKRHDFKYHQ